MVDVRWMFAHSLAFDDTVYVRTLRLKVAWDVPLSELSSISLESQGIALLLRGGIQGPFLQLPDVSRTRFLGCMESQLTLFFPHTTRPSLEHGSSSSCLA